jgi:hypothetical protein
MIWPNRRGACLVRPARWIIALVLATTACVPFLLDDRCGPEFRVTAIGGSLYDGAGIKLGHAGVELTEARRDVQPRVLHATFMGPASGDVGPLAGHVQQVRLLSASGAVLHQFPVDAGNGEEFARASLQEISDPTAFETLRQEFRRGGVIIELDTDVPGLEHPRVTTLLTADSDWQRVHCS